MPRPGPLKADPLQTLMHPLIIAFQLLTRIPLPFAVDYSPRNHGHSILFYPLVGLVMGMLLLLLAQLLSDQPVLLQATLLLVAWVGLSGGLHLDGLADSADAWVGGMGDRERMLEIMKDPACGPMGVIAIVLVLLLKWSALVALLESDMVALLLWGPLLARTLLITLFQSTPYLRTGGMGEARSQHIPYYQALLVQVGVLVLVLYSGIHWSVLLLLLLLFLLFRRTILQRLGGITGDIAGAMVEKMEALLLLLLVLFQ